MRSLVIYSAGKTIAIFILLVICKKNFHCCRFGTAVRDNKKAEMIIQRALAVPESFISLCAILVRLLVFFFCVFSVSSLMEFLQALMNKDEVRQGTLYPCEQSL